MRAGTMTLRRTCSCAALACAATMAAGQDSGQRFDAAHEAYDRGHYRNAFEVFASLADEGHCDAARIASQMVRWGRPLYALTLEVSAARLRQWQSLRGCPPPTLTTAASVAGR